MLKKNWLCDKKCHKLQTLQIELPLTFMSHYVMVTVNITSFDNLIANYVV